MNTNPSSAILLAIGMISASALAYEVLLMRLFSIVQWHHFAFMIISLALLGYGVSGVVLALNRERLMRRFRLMMVANMMLFGISAPLCFLVAQEIPFYPAEMLWSLRPWLYLSIIYLILAIPFFFAANVLGLAFYRYKKMISSVYAADLLGAGAGSVGIILLLLVIFPQKILTVLIVLAVGASLITIHYGFWEHGAEIGAWFGAPLIIGVAVIFMLTEFMALNISPYKSQNQLLRVPGTKIIDRYSSPLGVISVVSSGVTPLRHAPGQSLNAATEPPEQLAVFVDADNISAITAFDGKLEPLAYLDQTTSALPFHLKRFGDALIIGAGTGSEVLQARYHAAAHIDAVELNPQIIDLVKEKYADFAGHIYDKDRVTLYIDDARGFLAASAKSYDLINLSLLDAFGASAGGVYSMAENYLYTEQAIVDYVKHLKPEGFLSLTRWIKIPPRDEVKLLNTVIHALKRNRGVIPGAQLIMIRGWQTSTLIIKNGLVSGAEIDALKRFCDERGFDPVYYPGVSESEVNRYNIQQQPYLYQAVAALLSDNGLAFSEAYKFNVEPATDDKPYLFHFFKWRTLPESLSLTSKGGSFLLESGYLLLVAALSQAILASLLLIALPLWLAKDKLGISPGTKRHFTVLAYFFCLGLGFMFVEIAFIQKFILILHHPLYAITAVLSTFLLSAGVGSHFSSKFTARNCRTSVLLPVAGIALLCASYLLSFESLCGFVLGMGSLGRYCLSLLMIAPLGFFMGMPFPIALARLGLIQPALIPWAWGINGCASVISAILATLIAMQFGFTVLIVLALGIYGVAVWFFPRAFLEEARL